MNKKKYLNPKYLTLYEKYVHREVYKENFGKIPFGWVIHHIDENKQNNHPTNLVMMPERLHNKLHSEQWRTGKYLNKQEVQSLVKRWTKQTRSMI